MLRRVAVQVEDAERAAAFWEGAGGERVRTAPFPAAARAARGLVAGRPTDSGPIGGTVGPGFVRLPGLVVRGSHPACALLGGYSKGQIESIVGRKQRAGARPLPLVRVAEPFAERLAHLGGFARAYPDDRELARDVGELELVDAGARLLRALFRRVVEGRHEGAAADLRKERVRGEDRPFAGAIPTGLGSERMLRDRRVALAGEPRSLEDVPHVLHLAPGVSVGLLELQEERLVLLLQARPRGARRRQQGRDDQRGESPRSRGVELAAHGDARDAREAETSPTFG